LLLRRPESGPEDGVETLPPGVIDDADGTSRAPAAVLVVARHTAVMQTGGTQRRRHPGANGLTPPYDD